MRIALVSLAKGSGCPPIGLVYLGTYLQKHLDVEVDIIDKNFIPKVDITKKYDLIGISSMTVHYDEAIKLGKEIKKHSNIPIVIGGVHISTCPESFDPEAFDAMVRGEGEQSLLDAVNDLERNGQVSKLYINNDIKNLDDLPRPNWDLIDPRYFKEAPNTTFGEFGVEGWLLTSRGCPYNCSFCSTRQMWGKPRFHSAEYIYGLLYDLNEKGATHVQIWDDLFTINIPRLKKIRNCYHFGMKFNCQPRVDLIDDELCEILKDMGITTCIFGFESGSDKTLSYLKNKTCTTGDNKKAILTCVKHRLEVQGSVIFGSPGETVRGMGKSLDFMRWALDNGVQRLWPFVLTPFPGTKVWELLREKPRWSELSHQNETPLLLDKSVSLPNFKRVMYIARQLETRFRFKKILHFLAKNPIKTLKYILTNWKEVIRLVNTDT